MSTAPTIPSTRPWVGAAIIGGMLGLIVGIVLDLVVWLAAMAATLASGAGLTIPLLIATNTSSTSPDAVASFGVGLVLLPALVSVAGAVLGRHVAISERS